MIGRKEFFAGIIIGALISSILFFFNGTSIISWASVLIGFITAIIFSSVIFILFRDKWFGNSSTGIKTSTLATTIVLICVGLVSTYFILDHQEIKNSILKIDTEETEKQIALINANTQGNLVGRMSDVLKKVVKETETNPNRVLSKQVIDQISVLSYSFKPYRYLKEGTLSDKKLSPERGQLLLSLSKLNIDSISFENILFTSSFAGADLKDADLFGAQLDGIDLRGANLKDADLRSISLKNADLKDANLWGAKLSGANLENIKLNRANLSWANLEKANLRRAIINGANLNSAKINNADLSDTEIRWADLANVFLKNSRLSRATLYGSVLEKANLSNTELDDVKLIFTNLRDTDLAGADMSGVNLIKAGVKEANWIDKLKKGNVKGVKGIEEVYKVILDESNRTEYILLKK